MLFSDDHQKKISLSSLPLKFAGGIICYFITAVFIFFIPFTGAQVQTKTSPVQLTAHEKKWLASHPVVRIAPDPNFPPIESIDKNGKYEGISAEFMQVLQKATGIDFKIVRCKNWDEVLEKTKSGEVDALPAVALTPERSKYLLYSEPHIVLPGVIITSANVKKEVTLKNLSAMRVSIVQSYVWQEFLEIDFPDIQLDLVPDLKTALKKVAMGISDALVATLPVALYYIEKEGITNLRIAGETGYYTRLSFATRIDWPELNAIVNKALSQIPRSKKDEILRNWIHLGGKSIFKNNVFWIILTGFVGGGGLIILVIVMWNKSLRRIVNQRTAQLSIELSERRQAEERLKKSEAMLESIFQASPLGIGLVKNGKMQWHNETMSRMLGYTSADIVGKNARIIYSSAEEFDRSQEAINTLWSEKETSDTETRWTRRDGSIFNCHVRYALLDAESKDSAVLTIAEDITERKKAEAERQQLEIQLQQAQKMEAIGNLAGGIAHDFNNLLMGIQGRTSLMMADKESSCPDFEHLEGIGDYVKSAANLTKQLLGFARAGKYEVKSTDINKMIKKTARMFGRTKKEIKIHEAYQKNVWPTEIDRGQIEQVLMNLYVNAWQAMPDGGELYLKTKNIILGDDHEKRFKVAPGRYIEISVMDTGVGMDKATRQRIFEPFFTTKEMGRGTGLGLASVYGIIHNHAGFIEVCSEKDDGATFQIYLPASEKEMLEEKKLSEALLTGEEMILLVDDEAMIIDIGRQMLEKLGYTVFTAMNGKDAIKIYKENRADIRIAIIDMIMPGMGGGEVFDRLKEIRSDIRVLLSSGYCINGRATEILERGCDGFIQKPFSLKGLSLKLREILDGEKP